MEQPVVIIVFLLVFGRTGGLQFFPSRTGNFSYTPLGPAYVFSFRSADDNATSEFVTQVKATGDSNRTVFYIITNSSDESRVVIEKTSGELHYRPYPDRENPVAVVYVKAEEVRMNETDTSTKLSPFVPAIAKVTINYYADRRTEVVLSPVAFNLVHNALSYVGVEDWSLAAVRYTMLIGDVIGQVQLTDRETARTLGVTYRIGKAAIFDPASSEHLGEIRGFDTFPKTGDIFVKMLLAEYNQRLFNFTVTAWNSQRRLVTEAQVFAWIYDDPQELQLILGTSPSDLLGHGYANLTAMLSEAFGGPIAVGKIADIAVGGRSMQRSAIKLVVLDKTGRYILDSNTVISKLQRTSRGYLALDKLLKIRSIQGTQRMPFRRDLSLPAILLIAICSVLLLSIIGVLCIFCKMKRRFSSSSQPEKRTLPASMSIAPPHGPIMVRSARGSFISHPYDRGSMRSRSVRYAVPSCGMLPQPYMFGNNGNAGCSFRSTSLVAGPPCVPSNYEEQELSLSVDSDGDSGRHTGPSVSGNVGLQLSDAATKKASEPSLFATSPKKEHQKIHRLAGQSDKKELQKTFF